MAGPPTWRTASNSPASSSSISAAPAERNRDRRDSRLLAGELPRRLVVARQLHAGDMRPHHLNRHDATLEDAVVKILLGHLAGLDHVRVERAQLDRAHHVTDLVERGIVAVERATHLARRCVPVVTDAIDEEIDALLRRPFAEV